MILLMIFALLIQQVFTGGMAEELCSEERPCQVSFIRIISIPEDYDEKVIKLIGVIEVDYHGSALYLDHRSKDKYITPNMIKLKLSHDEIEKYKKFSGSHVSLIGRFKVDHSYDVKYAGSIHDVIEIIIRG